MMQPGMFLSQPGIEMLASYHWARHHGFDGIGDEVARLEREAHAVGAHRDAVADADRVEPHADQAGGGDALLDLLGQLEKVHVARVAFEPDAGDADLRLVHVFLAQAGGVEHRLRGALGFRLGDSGAELVQLSRHILKVSES